MKQYCHCTQPEKHKKYNFCTKCFHVIHPRTDWGFNLMVLILGAIWFIALVITDHR